MLVIESDEEASKAFVLMTMHSYNITPPRATVIRTKYMYIVFLQGDFISYNVRGTLNKEVEGWLRSLLKGEVRRSWSYLTVNPNYKYLYLYIRISIHIYTCQ